MTTARIDTPTCGAAIPTPSFLYIVSAMLSSKVLTFLVILSTGTHTCLSTGSPIFFISIIAIFSPFLN